MSDGDQFMMGLIFGVLICVFCLLWQVSAKVEDIEELLKIKSGENK